MSSRTNSSPTSARRARQSWPRHFARRGSAGTARAPPQTSGSSRRPVPACPWGVRIHRDEVDHDNRDARHGTIATGDLRNPLANGDAIAIRAGRIQAIGTTSDFDRRSLHVVIDARGTTAAPGLIDPHVHPLLGDWHPRQTVLGWMESAFHGGVTSMVSQGAHVLLGRPRDAFSAKALV